jgi:diguanylate cyclase (GGDEF)-like protein/putative nucleotidyltransferase with HDIG domain
MKTTGMAATQVQTEMASVVAPQGGRTTTRLIIVLGVIVLIPGLLEWRGSEDPVRYACYFLLAALASLLKVNWGNSQGALPMHLLFVLISLIDFSISETLLLGVFAAVALEYSLHRPHRRIEKMLFSASSMAIAITLADYAYHITPLENPFKYNLPLQMVLGGLVFFIGHTFPSAAVEAHEAGLKARNVWREEYFWRLPYYVAGAGVGGLMKLTVSRIDWRISVLLIPLMSLLYRSYRLYMGRLEDGRKHAEELASLHLRTIEALALAIDAKDHTTHDHLQRVQIYAMEVGKELGLTDTEVEALRAASLLHDIGKLAVPEHIISKPGKLTPEEFDKMKIHPVIGAEILERVRFPYPVVPIVRSHHEKWDGTGYPDGLKGEAIPIGARILAAVDCLDALASDRQYRKALPIDQAVGVVVRDAGKAFDPRVAEIIARRYIELERMATASRGEPFRLSTDVRVERGAAPAAGFESSHAPVPGPSTGGKVEASDFLAKIAAARQEAQAIFELAQSIGNTLSLDETLSVVAVRLKRLVPYDALAVYLRRDNRLLPEFVSGDNFRLFASLEIPVGEGLSGWVAENGKPILNGNPSVEPGYSSDSTRFSLLRAALAVPLEGLNGVVGVMALYSAERDSFTKDHLRILQAISSKLSLHVENALKFRQAETSATTDFLTGLPNARSLFLHLDAELARCRRSKEPLTVLVCDLDGFKQVNDSYGHLEGNRLLKAVGQALANTCREYDYVARMGGDEFVVVLPGMKLMDVKIRAENMNKVVGNAAGGIISTATVTMSIGASHFPEDGADAEELLAEADRRMYKAKLENHADRAEAHPELREAVVSPYEIQ